MQALHLTTLQLDLRWEDPEANRSHIESLLAAHVGPTDVILLPEMFTTGFSMNPEKLAEDTDGPSTQWMRWLAHKRDALVMGSLIIQEEGLYFNRFLAVGPKGIVGQYDKRHCFRMAGEHEHYVAGTTRVVFSWRGWRICPQVCYDLRFPVWSRVRSGPDGPDYDLLVYVANWPEPRVAHWDILLKARAIENQSFVAGVNRVGTDGKGMSYVGHSTLLDPMGRELAFSRDTEAVLTTILDPEKLTSLRENFPVWKDADGMKGMCE